MSGGIGWIDPATGKYEALAVLPCFTRDLDFCGLLAERCCGVLLVNIHTGQTVAFVKFEDAVQEIARSRCCRECDTPT